MKYQKIFRVIHSVGFDEFYQAGFPNRFNKVNVIAISKILNRQYWICVDGGYCCTDEFYICHRPLDNINARTQRIKCKNQEDVCEHLKIICDEIKQTRKRVHGCENS